MISQKEDKLHRFDRSQMYNVPTLTSCRMLRLAHLLQLDLECDAVL